MKKTFVITMCLFSLHSFAQTGLWSAGWAKVDYSVPESPAFNLLGTTPDNILKPTSARDITLSIGNYFITSGPIIPKSLSVEIAPWLLANQSANLYRYNKNLFVHRIRFSLGTTTTGSNGSYSVAEGLRFTIFDKTDLKADKMFNAEVQQNLSLKLSITKYIEDNYTSDLDAIVKASGVKQTDNKTPLNLYNELKSAYAQPTLAGIPASVVKVYEKTQAFILKKAKELEATNNTEFMAVMAQEQKEQEENDKKISEEIDKIKTLREKYKNKLWNAPIMELGIAAMQNSADSLIKNLKVAQYGIWWNFGTHFCKNDQLLLGANYKVVDSITWQSNLSLGARYFYGSNNVRGFVQAQYDDKNSIKSFTASIGCQFNLVEKLWAQIVLNFVTINNKTSFQPGFNLGFGSLGNNKTPSK